MPWGAASPKSATLPSEECKHQIDLRRGEIAARARSCEPKIEATVLEVKMECSSGSLRADSPSRVRALERAVCDALDCSRRSGSLVQLRVAGAAGCLAQPAFTATGPWPFFRLEPTGRFTRAMAASRSY